jgi:hypothetical protein
LISLKWTLINEEYITFVHKRSFAYCYNLVGGPISKSDATKKMLNDKIVIIPQSGPFVIKR